MLYQLLIILDYPKSASGSLEQAILFQTTQSSVSKYRLKYDHTDKSISRCELYSCADMIFTGNNLRIISFTVNICYVDGLHKSFYAIKDIPVAQVGIKFQLNSGAVYILLVNKALYFSHLMDHSMIYPNPIHHYCIILSNNPFNSDKHLLIDHNKIFFLFSIKLSAIYLPHMYQWMQCWIHVHT